MTLVDFGQFRFFVLSVLFCFVCFVSTDLFGFLIYWLWVLIFWLWVLIFWLWVPIFLKLDINVRITCSTWIKAVCCKALYEHNILNILLYYCICLSKRQGRGCWGIYCTQIPCGNIRLYICFDDVLECIVIASSTHGLHRQLWKLYQLEVNLICSGLLYIIVCPIVLFRLAIILTVLLWFTVSNYPCGIFKRLQWLC